MEARDKGTRKPKIRHRIISAISNRGPMVIIGSILLIALIFIAIAYEFVLPTPPDTLVMTTGFEGGLMQRLVSDTDKF